MKENKDMQEQRKGGRSCYVIKQSRSRRREERKKVCSNNNNNIINLSSDITLYQ